MQPKRRQSEILKLSIQQAITWIAASFKEEANSDLHVKMVANSNGLRELEPTLTNSNNEKMQLSYPFALATIGDISIDGDKAGFKPGLSKKGIFVANNDGVGRNERIRPVNVTLGFNFRTDTMDHILDLAHVLFMNAPKKVFRMQSSSGFRVESSVGIDPSITIPQTNFDTPGDAYQYEFVLVLHTYLGYSEDIPLIKTVTFSVVEDSGTTMFYNGEPFVDMKQSINFKDYYDKESQLYKGYEAVK